MQKRRLFTSAALAVAALGCGAVPVPQILQSAEVASANTRRIAVVYFTKSGNTQSLAEAVRAMTGADLYRVETIEPYPDSYGPATEVVKDELERGIIRPIKPLAVNLALYDVIVLATPTWWHHVAMPLQTWIKSVDLSGKKDPHRQHARRRRPHGNAEGLQEASCRQKPRHAPHRLRRRTPSGQPRPQLAHGERLPAMIAATLVERRQRGSSTASALF